LPFYYCRANTNFVGLLLLTAVSVEYYECVSVLLLWISCMQMSSFMCRITFHLWPLRFYRIFPHCCKNGTILSKHLLNIK
jgi:hypothetical protein